MSENVRGEVSSVGRDVASSRAEWEPAAAAAALGRKHMSAFVWSLWRRNLPVYKAVTPAQLTRGGRRRGKRGGLLTSFFSPSYVGGLEVLLRGLSGLASLEFIFLAHNLECSLCSHSFTVNTLAEH